MPQRSAEFLKTQRFQWSRRPGPAIVSSGLRRCLPACPLCCLQPLPPTAAPARTVLICRLFQLWFNLRLKKGLYQEIEILAHCWSAIEDLCWLQKMERNCDGHGSPWQQHLGCRQWTDGEAKQQRLYDAGGVQQQTPAVQWNSKRRRLGFQDKPAEAEASPSQRTRRAFLRSRSRSRSRREMLVREWGNKLGSAIRRAAALCLSPPSAASAADDEDDELDLPYVQLDKVTTRAVRREAFGPLYLVT